MKVEDALEVLQMAYFPDSIRKSEALVALRAHHQRVQEVAQEMRQCVYRAAYPSFPTIWEWADRLEGE